MKNQSVRWITGALLLSGHLFAAIQYTGKISVNNSAYSGTGNFKFALINSKGELAWSHSDNTPPIESEPTGTVKLLIKNGTYTVKLGDTGQGMLPVPKKISDHAGDYKLRIWFNDGTHGFAEVGTYAIAAEAKAPDAAGMDVVLAELRQIRSELAAIKRQPAAAPAPAARPAAPRPPTKVTLPYDGEYTILGNPKAKVVLMEFTDYQCGYCAKFFLDTYPELVKKYVDTGKLAFVSRHLPLDFHDQALPAARALLCIKEQDPKAYWDMRGRLFKNMKSLNPLFIRQQVQALNIEMKKYDACISGGTTEAILARDKKDADSAGIGGTPSFVLGTVDGKTVKGIRMVGARPMSYFAEEIDKLLAASE